MVSIVSDSLGMATGGCDGVNTTLVRYDTGLSPLRTLNHTVKMETTELLQLATSLADTLVFTMVITLAINIHSQYVTTEHLHCNQINYNNNLF